MLAKVLNQKGYRIIDVGDDFFVLSESIDNIRKNYCKVIENIEEKVKKSKDYSESKLQAILYEVYLYLFKIDVVAEFFDNSINEKLYDKLKDVDEYEKLVNAVFIKSNVCKDIICNADLIGKFENDFNRITAIKYLDKHDKQIVEIFIKKNIYIVNNAGKTVEAYKNNFVM